MSDIHELGLLLEHARLSEQDALSELVKRLRPWVRQQARLLLRGFRGPTDASDVAQEVCLRVDASFSQFRGTDVPRLLGWVGRILRNVVADQFRRQGASMRRADREVRGRQLLRSLISEDLAPAERLLQDERAVQLAAALERLPHHQREVLEGRFFDQRSFAEIAQQMGKSEGALRVVCLRALDRLRNELGDLS